MSSKKIYEEVSKNYKQFYEKLEMSLNYLINKYYNYFNEDKKEKLFVLEDMSKDLDKVINLLDNYGYTFYPSNVDDVSEDNFEEIIMRYLESFKKYVENGDSNVETINVNVKTLAMLIDKHKTISEHFE